MPLGNRAFKQLYRLHVYLGLFVALQFAVLGLTGIPLLFRHELNGLGAGTSSRDFQALPAAYSQALEHARRLSPRSRPLAMFPDEHVPGTFQLRSGVGGSVQLRGAERLRFNARTGAPLDPLDGASSPSASAGRLHAITDWLLGLHREFFLGAYGKLYVGWVGVLYSLMLVSGLVIYGRFMKTRSLKDLWRAARAGIARPADLHKLSGVVTAAWGLVVGISGTLLALNGWMIKIFLAQSLHHLGQRYAESPVPMATADLSQVVTTALAASPGARLEYLAFPGAEYGIAGHFLALLDERLLVIDAATGGLTETVALPLYLRLARWAEPIHFANYGGWAFKILWGVFAAGSLGVVAFGVSSFVLKRRKYRAPALGGQYA